MANNELNVRIALKYDSYSAWTTGPGKDVVLLAGEIGICEIPSNDSTTAPIVLFKVGDGEKTFENLPWASAKAYDVHDWAKASDVKLVNNKLIFVGGKADGADLEIQLNYATLDELESIKENIEVLITGFDELKDIVDADNNAEEAFSNLESRLDVIEGEATVEGSIKKAASDTLTATKAYTDTETQKITDQIELLQTKSEEHSDLISENASKLDSAISGIAETLGGSYSKDATVHMAIEDAKQTSTDVQQQVTSLANGQVATNTQNIATNTTNIEILETALEAETSERETAEEGFNTRLTKVEAFFEGAYTEDGKPIKEALDTLVEIQNYLNGSNSSGDNNNTSGDLINRVATNETAIKAIQDLVKTGGTFDTRIEVIGTDLTEIKDRTSILESVTEGYTTKGSIKTAIETAASSASAAITTAISADAKASQAQADINTLAGIVNNDNTGLVKKVDSLTSNVELLTTDFDSITDRVDTAEEAISALQSIVSSGGDTNAALRADITELQNIVISGNNTNAAIRSDLTTLQAAVNHTSTGLAKTYEIAVNNTNNIEAIQDDYLKEADEFILNCGTSVAAVQNTN